MVPYVVHYFFFYIGLCALYKEQGAICDTSCVSSLWASQSHGPAGSEHTSLPGWAASSLSALQYSNVGLASVSGPVCFYSMRVYVQYLASDIPCCQGIAFQTGFWSIMAVACGLVSFISWSFTVSLVCNPLFLSLFHTLILTLTVWHHLWLPLLCCTNFL